MGVEGGCLGNILEVVRLGKILFYFLLGPCSLRNCEMGVYHMEYERRYLWTCWIGPRGKAGEGEEWTAAMQ